MKKFLSLISCIILLFTTGVAFAEDSEIIYFDPVISNTLDNTASKWFTTDETRALVTVTLILDMCLELDNFAELIDLSEGSYVGKEGTCISVYLQGKASSGHDYILIYEPMNETAAYKLMDDYSPTFAEIIMNKVCTDGLHENDIELLHDYILEFSEML